MNRDVHQGEVRTLGPGQSARLIGLGLILWALAAILVRYLAPLGVLEGPAALWTYGAVLLGTWPVLLLVVRLAALAPRQVVPGTALLTLVALLIDGSVFAWVPQLYAAPDRQLACAATVLWGAGVALLLAFAHEWRSARRPG